VDWSGARGERVQRQSIWCCQASHDRKRIVVDSLTAGRTRGETVEWLIQRSHAVEPLVAGLDFSFSLPRGYVAQHLGQEHESWSDVVAWCRREGEAVLQACPPPFWGHPGTRRPAPDDLVRFGLRALTRRTEQGLGTAKSPLQIAGPGQVGTGTLRGIPWLAELRRAGFAIWPFDRPRGGQPTAVEIYPRLFTPGVRKRSEAGRRAHLAARCGRPDVQVPMGIVEQAARRDDAFDALCSAIGMWQWLQTGGPHRCTDEFYADPAVRTEGWICGVAFRERR
jgi:hypothetical protein